VAADGDAAVRSVARVRLHLDARLGAVLQAADRLPAAPNHKPNLTKPNKKSNPLVVAQQESVNK
jgi:hypothetical protein